jgi:predicted O-methyltransferase YrrM
MPRQGEQARDAIPGWFNEVDQRCFRALLGSQRGSPPGDLVELGVFMGKSAVLIADFLRPDERFVVVDLFGDEEHFDHTAEHSANRREAQTMYRNLTREAFEQNYLSVHDQLPVVVQGFTSEVVDHVAPGSARFIHIDASHLYGPVRTDCRSAKTLLRPDGVVAFDDYRSARWPGVGAAVWESVVTDGMIPVATTRKKLYACYGEAEAHQETLRRMVAEDPDFYDVEELEIMGRTVLRLGLPRRRPAPPRARRVRAALSRRARRLGAALRPGRSAPT